MIRQLFQNWISAFFGVDVMVSAIVLLAFILAECESLNAGRCWACVVGAFLVGVSLGLPLFLYFRASESE